MIPASGPGLFWLTDCTSSIPTLDAFVLSREISFARVSFASFPDSLILFVWLPSLAIPVPRWFQFRLSRSTPILFRGSSLAFAGLCLVWEGHSFHFHSAGFLEATSISRPNMIWDPWSDDCSILSCLTVSSNHSNRFQTLMFLLAIRAICRTRLPVLSWLGF
jgi:hypothetical protein